jgi:hypothetical protein
MIDQEQLIKIGKFLDAEKIYVIPKQSIICVPKKQDSEFIDRFKKIEEEIKKFPFVDIQIIEEGEICNGYLEVPTESSSNGAG